MIGFSVADSVGHGVSGELVEGVLVVGLGVGGLVMKSCDKISFGVVFSVAGSVGHGAVAAFVVGALVVTFSVAGFGTFVSEVTDGEGASGLISLSVDPALVFEDFEVVDFLDLLFLAVESAVEGLELSVDAISFSHSNLCYWNVFVCRI